MNTLQWRVCKLRRRRKGKTEMKTNLSNPSQPTTFTGRTMQHILLLACVAALAAMPAQATHAASDAVPPMPANLEVPAGNKLFLVGYASGTQQYMCLFNGASFAWSFFGPQATLFKDNDKPIISHYLSPNPAEGGTPRAAWQHNHDASTVWATPITSSTDSAYVAPGAIPWLLLQVKGVQAGPGGGDKLTKTTFIQRLNTSGGVAPTSGCTALADVGKKALVPYTTYYFFYKSTAKE
jgi:hypothetical protein